MAGNLDLDDTVAKGSSKRKRQLGSESEDDVSLDDESDFEPEAAA
jgi:hypothetical protein